MPRFIPISDDPVPLQRFFASMLAAGVVLDRAAAIRHVEDIAPAIRATDRRFDEV